MLAEQTVIIGIVCYFALIILVGYLMKNKNKGAEDFLVGGRSFGLFFNAGTLTACGLGGSLLIGVPGTIYSCGIWDSDARWGVLVTITGIGCLVVLGAFYMRKLWQLKLLSLGDFYYLRFGKTAGIISTVLMSFTFTLWIAVQIVAFAKVGTTLVGIPLNVWIIISMAVICTYTILGGLWAVCLTDIIQVIIVTISILLLTPIVLHMAGGWDSFVVALPKEKLEFLPQDKSLHGWLPWLAAWVIIGLGSVASPDLMQRAFSAKTGNIARNSAFCAAGMCYFFIIVVGILTFATMQLIKQGSIETTMISADPELLLPAVFEQIMPAPVVAIFLGATMAAVMSAAATANIALSGVISKNLIKDIFIPQMSSYGVMQTTRVVILIVGIIGAVVAIGLPSVYFLTSLGFDLILSCMFVPLTLGLYWKKTNGYGATAGMIAGAIVRIIGSGYVNGFTLEGIGTPTETWYYFTLSGPIASLIVTVAVSLLTQKKNRPLELNFEPNP